MTRILKTLIVLSACNHGRVLPDVFKATMATGYDLLLIEDGSTDNSLLCVAGGQCRILRFEKHRGNGAVLVEGAKQAEKLGYDTIVTIEGSGQYDPADIRLLVGQAETSAHPCVVIGVPQYTEGKDTASNSYLKTAADFWIRLECGLELPDIKSTFRLYPVRELLALNLSEKLYTLTIESIVKLSWSGIQVVSIPVTVHKRQEEDNTLSDALFSIFLHGRLLLRRLLPWPHKKLTPQEPFPKKVLQTLSANPIKVLRQICREHTAPFWLALAVWLGIFMGALPLLATHTVAIIYVAHKLHLNKVAAVAASQFCMPPVVPVLCIQTGYFLRNGALLIDFSWQPWLLEIHQRLWEWLLGSLLVGPLLGLIGAIVMHCTASRLQHHKFKNHEG
jgi:uncharacterized protein (DUF2062 family)